MGVLRQLTGCWRMWGTPLAWAHVMTVRLVNSEPWSVGAWPADDREPCRVIQHAHEMLASDAPVGSDVHSLVAEGIGDGQASELRRPLSRLQQTKSMLQTSLLSRH